MAIEIPRLFGRRPANVSVSWTCGAHRSDKGDLTSPSMRDRLIENLYGLDCILVNISGPPLDFYKKDPLR